MLNKRNEPSVRVDANFHLMGMKNMRTWENNACGQHLRHNIGQIMLHRLLGSNCIFYISAKLAKADFSET